MSETKRPPVDEEELEQTMVMFRSMYSKLVRLPVIHPAGKEGKDELISILTSVGKKMKQVIDDLKEMDDFAGAREDDIVDLSIQQGPYERLVEMVQDMDRRVVTPREVINYVKENFRE